MALDGVLAEPEVTWLGLSRDKAETFTNPPCCVPPAALPRTAVGGVVRPCPDPFPIGLAADGTRLSLPRHDAVFDYVSDLPEPAPDAGLCSANLASTPAHSARVNRTGNLRHRIEWVRGEFRPPATRGSAGEGIAGEEDRALIERGGRTQGMAARILEVDQPKVSALKRGRLAAFSLDRLVRSLVLPGNDVKVVGTPRATGAGQARVIVA